MAVNYCGICFITLAPDSFSKTSLVCAIEIGVYTYREQRSTASALHALEHLTFA